MHEFGERMEIEFEHDVGAMSLGGIHTDAEEGGNLLVGSAFGEELEDFAFTGSETKASAGEIGRREIVGGRRSGDASGEVRLVLADGIDSGEENAVGIIFEDVAASTGFDHLLNEVVRLVHGEDEDFGGGRGGTDAASGLDTVEQGHADVEDGHVGFEFCGFFDGVAAVGRFGADFPS